MAKKKQPKPPSLPLSVLAPENLPFQMFLLVQQMTRRFQQILKPHQLTPLHWGILCCLWKKDGQRTSSIARQLDQLGGTITVGLDLMEQRQLILRMHRPTDRRVSYIYLTPKGRNLRTVLEPAAEQLIRSIFSALTPSEYVHLVDGISTLRSSLATGPVEVGDTGKAATANGSNKTVPG